jgi:hypothetical protein
MLSTVPAFGTSPFAFRRLGEASPPQPLLTAPGVPSLVLDFVDKARRARFAPDEVMGYVRIMPLYEYRKNAVNCVPVPRAIQQEIVCGTEAVLRQVIALIKGKKKTGQAATAAVDGWYGVDWEGLKSGLSAAAKAGGLSLGIVSTAGLFRSAAEIEEYRLPFVGGDPSFGLVNSKGSLEDILDEQKLAALKEGLASRAQGATADALLVIGPGAAAGALEDLYDLRFYADFTMQPLLWQMWDGKLTSFGSDKPAPDYSWKKYYYCDFYLLLRQKKKAFARMDYYLDAVEPQNLKLVSGAGYNTMIDELVKRPIKQVKIAQPGPWGAYRFKQIYDPIPGLECMAWNELAGIELSILADVGAAAPFNLPCQNVLQRPVQMVGEQVHRTFPDLLPLQVWLDEATSRNRSRTNAAACPSTTIRTPIT